MVKLAPTSGGYDAIIIGAGHNGLVCAGYLARAHMKVLVLESREMIGGGAVTRPLGEGFKASGCAHVMTGFDPAIVRDLRLSRHGLKFADKGLATVGLVPDGRHLYLGREMTRMKSAIAAHSTRDADSFEALWKAVLRLAGVIRSSLLLPPPIPDEPYQLAHATLRMMDKKLNHLRADERRLFRELLPMSIAEFVQRSFDAPALQGLFTALACLGNGTDPRAPGTALMLLLRFAFEQDGGRGLLELPKGGLGGLTEALARAAERFGAEVRKDASVTRIDVVDGRAVGVFLKSGEQIAAPLIVSNVDPKTTFRRMLPEPALDTGFRRRLDHFRTRGVAAKINVALRGLPNFTGLSSDDMAGRLIVAPDLAYVQNAYADLMRGKASMPPVMEILIPTIRDPSLAPNGRHVMSIIAQYMPKELGDGGRVARDTYAVRLGEELLKYAPDFGDLIEDYEVLAPGDIEQMFGLPDGDWHQGERAIDQMLWLRPSPAAANYRSPISGLYICGAGTHPGGGVAGISGRLAAQAILKRERSS